MIGQNAVDLLRDLAPEVWARFPAALAHFETQPHRYSGVSNAPWRLSATWMFGHGYRAFWLAPHREWTTFAVGVRTDDPEELFVLWQQEGRRFWFHGTLFDSHTAHNRSERVAGELARAVAEWDASSTDIFVSLDRGGRFDPATGTIGGRPIPSYEQSNSESVAGSFSVGSAGCSGVVGLADELRALRPEPGGCNAAIAAACATVAASFNLRDPFLALPYLAEDCCLTSEATGRAWRGSQSICDQWARAFHAVHVAGAGGRVFAHFGWSPASDQPVVLLTQRFSPYGAFGTGVPVSWIRITVNPDGLISELEQKITDPVPSMISPAGLPGLALEEARAQQEWTGLRMPPSQVIISTFGRDLDRQATEALLHEVELAQRRWPGLVVEPMVSQPQETARLTPLANGVVAYSSQTERILHLLPWPWIDGALTGQLEHLLAEDPTPAS